MGRPSAKDAIRAVAELLDHPYSSTARETLDAYLVEDEAPAADDQTDDEKPATPARRR